MFRLIRSARWRRGYVVGCAAYLLFSMLADFAHVHPLAGFRSPTVATAGQAISAPGNRTHRVPDATCAICQWQRLAPGLPAAATASATMSTPAAILPSAAAVPKSPIPHPSAFRGPPSPSYS